MQLIRRPLSMPLTISCSQSIQGKQDSLLQRIDSLDREREDLREETGELAEERDALEEALGKAEEQRSRMKEQLLEEQVSYRGPEALEGLSGVQVQMAEYLRFGVSDSRLVTLPSVISAVCIAPN